MPIVHTLKWTDYDQFLIQVMMVEEEMGRNVQVGMLSKLGVNQVSIPTVMSQSWTRVQTTSPGTGRFTPNTLSLWTFRLFTGGPVKRGRLVSYPGPRDVTQKYKVHQNAPFNKENSRIFSPAGPRENVSPGPAVAFDELCFGCFIEIKDYNFL